MIPAAQAVPKWLAGPAPRREEQHERQLSRAVESHAHRFARRRRPDNRGRTGRNAGSRRQRHRLSSSTVAWQGLDAGSEMVELAEDLGVAAQQPGDEQSEQTDGSSFQYEQREQSSTPDDGGQALTVGARA
ncbi:MAG: hypothetical protein NVS3B12_12350 [Acidimicrobiales bacterium]